MRIKVNSQAEAAQAFKKYGTPVEVLSTIGTYSPYDSDSENDVFDEAMSIMYYAESITLVYDR